MIWLLKTWRRRIYPAFNGGWPECDTLESNSRSGLVPITTSRSGGGWSGITPASRPRLLLAMQIQSGLRSCQRLLLLAVVITAVTTELAGARQPTQKPAIRLSQGQAAGQFLRAVLRADYTTAYGRLAPEVRRSVSLMRFETVARPLWKSGVHCTPDIQLYKLGVRLGENGASRFFYSFSFAADSSLKIPSVLLEVTFRDTASRAILGFGVRPAGQVPAHRKG